MPIGTAVAPRRLIAPSGILGRDRFLCLSTGKSYVFMGHCAAPCRPRWTRLRIAFDDVDHDRMRSRCTIAVARVRSAYSLLEVVLASAICATALVPALAVLRDGMTLADIIDTRHLLLTYGVSKMEEQLAIVGATWTDRNRDRRFRRRRPCQYPLQRHAVRRAGQRRNRRTG